MIAASGAAAATPRPGRAQSLVTGMTLAEKLGQLSILSADYAVTGPVVPTNVDADVRAGRVGSLFNLWGREAVREAQRIAVEETRLGIPLFFERSLIEITPRRVLYWADGASTTAPAVMRAFPDVAT